MNNEIKEILEELENMYEISELEEQVNNINKIKDYITNLQQKIEQYENPDDMTLFYMWLDAKAKDKMKELQQENHELKSKLECYENGAYYSSKVDELEQENERLKEWKEDLLKENIELENIRKEAVEYMQDFIFEPLLVQEDRKLIMFNENLRNFENILQNGSDSQ